MSAIATLAPTQLAVIPGREATAQLRVRNTGDVVDELSFRVSGAAAAWTVVEPASVSLLPGAESDAVVRFLPPLEGAPPAGPMPFAIVVLCREDPDGGVAEEGTIDVQPVVLLAAELVPRSARAARKAAFQLAIDNKGNAPTDVDAVGQAAGGDLRFDTDPATVAVTGGGVGFAQVEVRPAKRFWRGPTQSRPFQVVVTPRTPEGAAPVVVDGTMVQEPMIPKWAPAALAALIAAILALLLLWFTVLRPTVESAARDAVEEELEATLEDVVTDAVEDVVATTIPTTPPLSPGTPPTAPVPDPAGEPGGAGSGAGSGAGGSGDAFDRRFIEGTSAFTVADGQTLQLTDLVFGNPGGQTGELIVLRDGVALFELSLGNFRDFDYHFITPLIVGSGSTISAVLNCDSLPCEAYVLLSGTLSGGG
jgi:hypothetical protein